MDNDPLFPFGLSYTRFDYGEMSLSSSELSRDGLFTASVTVRNSGELSGKEVVQLYLRDMVGSVIRPVKVRL